MRKLSDNEVMVGGDLSPTCVILREKKKGKKSYTSLSIVVNGGPRFLIEPSKCCKESYFLFKKDIYRQDSNHLVGILQDGKLKVSKEADKLHFLEGLALGPKDLRNHFDDQNLDIPPVVINGKSMQANLPETPPRSDKSY